jgi:hypothetical protein
MNEREWRWEAIVALLDEAGLEAPAGATRSR